MPYSLDDEKQKANADLAIVRHQVLPRLRKLMISWSGLFALAATGALLLMVPLLPAARLEIREVANLGFNFASIAMGACLSALVLSLGLPGASRLRTWATLDAPNGKSRLSNLVFSFFWAGSCQLLVILTCILATLFGGDQSLAELPMPLTHWAGLGLGFFVFFYALSQLYIVLQTLVQTGVVIIFEERISQPPPPGE
ncbi:MAG TPA: hypothetical protein VIL55_04165 [Naasia sp.]|jgi:hypothetical protein